MAIRIYSTDRTREAVALPDTRGMTFEQAEAAVAAAKLAAAEAERMPIFIDGSFAGTLRDVRTNYATRRAEIDSAVESEKATATRR